ncbi:MAG: HD domain-containing protein [Burkholderiaceae bacterium]
MLIGRVEETAGQAQIYVVDTMREPVRLGAGLNAEKALDAPSQARAIAAIQRFGERLRSFSPENVRAVATNAVRVARNAKAFLAAAEAALGFPIEVIAGREEARLIYVGVSNLLPASGGNRLVIDVGGGSTEFVIGRDSEPLVLESLYIGCVSSSESFFPGGAITAKAMRQAVLAARREVEVLHREFARPGWEVAIGSSGTARAIAELLRANAIDESITPTGLRTLKQILIDAGHVAKLQLQGLRPDRLPVIAGGIAVMTGIVEELDIDIMQVSDGGLRQGVLYDLLGRSLQQDMRPLTVRHSMQRYGVDAQHAGRVAALTSRLLGMLGNDDEAWTSDQLKLVEWAALLHEIGLSISHHSYHKHGAYILRNADLPGFSRSEQELLANLVLGHIGKLGKLSPLLQNEQQWLKVLALRLAALFYRRRVPDILPDVTLVRAGRHLTLNLPQAWLKRHPLTNYTLDNEAAQWQKIGWRLDITCA